MRLRSRAWSILIACLVASTASAQNKTVDCPSASEDGQRLRGQSHFRQAHEQFRACSQASCPAVVRKDCAKWLTELDDTMPSVVVGVVDELGHDMTEAEISVDGEMLAAQVDGKPLIVDPGPHELRATASGRMPTTSSIVVRVGEKNRLVQMKFAAKPTQAAESDATHEARSPRLAPPRAAVGHSYLPPPLTILLGAVGALGLGSFAALGITAKSDLAVLRDTCAPNCAQNELDGVQTRMLLADLSLGVGVVALGTGTVLWILNARKPVQMQQTARSSWQLGASPRPGGASAVVTGSF